VFNQSFNGRQHSGYVDATSPSVFKQDTTDRAAIITEVFKGTGLWETRAEDQDISQASVRVTNQQTFSVTNFAKSVDISKNFFDDDQHTVYEKMVSDMAETARITRDTNAFAIFRGAFTTTLTNDGATLCSDTHTTISGNTVDNKGVAVFSESELNTAVINLVEQKAQDGTVRGSLPSVLLVPPALFKSACEVTKSEYRSGNNYNDINVY
jgi:phage major head subunit gpT-like protein